MKISAVNQNGMGNSSRIITTVVLIGGVRREMKVRVGKVKVTFFPEKRRLHGIKKVC